MVNKHMENVKYFQSLRESKCKLHELTTHPLKWLKLKRPAAPSVGKGRVTLAKWSNFNSYTFWTEL